MKRRLSEIEDEDVILLEERSSPKQTSAQNSSIKVEAQENNTDNLDETLIQLANDEIHNRADTKTSSSSIIRLLRNSSQLTLFSAARSIIPITTLQTQDKAPTTEKGIA